MNSPVKKVSPLTIGERHELAIAALAFFSLDDFVEKCRIIEKEVVPGHVSPFTVFDLVTYIEKRGWIPDIREHSYYVANLCDSLRAAGFLTFSGTRGVVLGACYFLVGTGTKMQEAGHLWLAGALGPEFLYEQLHSSVAMITGKSPEGDNCVGSGLVIAKRHILTCAHVLNEMTLDAEQTVGSVTYRIRRRLVHPKLDVGLIETENDLVPPSGLVFRDPILSEPVFNLGYPRITYTRASSLLMQRGEVTGTNVRLLSGDDVFLYSAIARPGNSGGPIVSTTGHVVGIVTQDLVSRAESTGEPVHPTAYASMPFYAGVPSSALAAAIQELQDRFTLPLETYQV